MTNKLQNAPIFQSKTIINLKAISDNWRFYDNLSLNTEAAAVVKANAYGLGAEKITPILQQNGCRTFFISQINEGLELRKILGEEAHIYALNGVLEYEVSSFLSANIIPVLNSHDQIELWRLNGKGRPFAIHIDTGMNRLGIRFDEATFHKDITPHLIISHLACSSNPNDEFNKIQLDRFLKIKDQFPNARFSLSASAGALLGDDYLFDLIRPGIGLYGANPFDYGVNQMRNVVTLQSPILQIRDIKKGESIGYGRSFIAQNDVKIATISQGYADGFLRSGSNSGFGIFENIKCPILGRVSMDLICLDISHITNSIKTGQMIELLGPNALIDEQATALGTISYEILTRLGDRSEWVYIEN